jgi:gas vesicle protein
MIREKEAEKPVPGKMAVKPESRDGKFYALQPMLPVFPGKNRQVLQNTLKVGGTLMIVAEVFDRLRNARSLREKTIRRNKVGALALGVSIGCTVGAVAGVLFAPRSGKETREDVGRVSGEAWEKVKDNVSSNGHRLATALEGIGTRISTLGDKAVDSVEEFLPEMADKSEPAAAKK